MNMPTILSNATWVEQIMSVVENCLKDERVEVRVKAGQVLGGLLHCSFVSKDRQDALLVSLFCSSEVRSAEQEHYKTRSCRVVKSAQKVRVTFERSRDWKSIWKVCEIRLQCKICNFEISSLKFFFTKKSRRFQLALHQRLCNSPTKSSVVSKFKLLKVELVKLKVKLFKVSLKLGLYLSLHQSPRQKNLNCERHS